ncbi:MAG: hypothetical protein KC503_02955 [Myxococcales bacterium]|nr:hypothetical protein [Myxococcales bacterium]
MATPRQTVCRAALAGLCLLSCYGARSSAAPGRPDPTAKPTRLARALSPKRNDDGTVTSTPRSRPRLSNVPPINSASSMPSSQPAGSVGGLIEDPSGHALDAFYASLRKVEQDRQGLTTVVQWGDSHTTADVLTGTVRSQLQQRFGDAGPGFTLVGKPWRYYRHDHAKLSKRGLWRAERIHAYYSWRRGRRRPRDDFFGAAGVSTHTRWRASATLAARRGTLSAVEIYYLRQRRGGRIAVRAARRRSRKGFAERGRLVRRIFTVSRRFKPGYARIELPPGTREVQLRTGGGEVRVFGVDLQRDAPGVRYHAFGLDGAGANHILKWNETLLADHVRRLAPQLVLLAYGSNEVDSKTMTREGFAKMFDEVLQKIRRVSPGASCLVLGPPDQQRYDRELGSWKRPEKLDYVIAEQRRLAFKHGCGFWDWERAMGGRGSLQRWIDAQPPLAKRDHVHFLVRGYRLLGKGLYRALMQRYKLYRIRTAARPAQKSVGAP